MGLWLRRRAARGRRSAVAAGASLATRGEIAAAVPGHPGRGTEAREASPRGPDPSPIPDPCTNPFPVAVPSGSAFVPAGAAVWWTNKIYPPAIRAALEATGYAFHSQSPAEDFMSKVVEIRVEVRNFADQALVAVFSFDARENFRLVRLGEFNGRLPIDPLVDPALGLDLSVDEPLRLPTFGFPVLAGPVPPGNYRAWVYFVLSDLHNDGLGLSWENPNFLPAGDVLVAFARFIVLP